MKTLTGNILSVGTGTILHQVNCRGVTGGLAAALARKHPVAFASYFTLCEKYGARNLGEVEEGHASDSLSIVHVFGQLEPGRSTDMAAVRAALKRAPSRLTGPVYAPYRMGCGIGGGDWPTYLQALTDAFPEIVIVKLPDEP